VAELLREGRLVAILDRYQAAPMPVTLLYPNRRHVAERAQRFMDGVAELQLPYVDQPEAQPG
jgi:DNA-binding transcriptional LysR family regulator